MQMEHPVVVPLARHASQRSGFAVVTALLVLAAISTLAAGAFFLTITNLRLAENNQAQTVARYNAEKWLDVTLMVVADAYVELGRLPTETELRPFLIDDGQYALTRYNVNGTVGEVQVTGFAGRGDAAAAVTRHPVSARFEGTTGASGVPGGPGFITPESINVSGASRVLLNMHAGGSLNISGNVDTGDPEAGQLFSYMSGTGQCSLGTAGPCLSGQDPPVVDPVLFDDLYDDAWDEYCSSGPNIVEPGGTSTRTINAVAGGVYCLRPAASRKNYELSGMLHNVTVIGGANTVVTVRAGSTGPDPSDPENDLGLRLYAGDIVLTSGNTLGDRNDVVSRGNVVLDRGVTATEEVADDGRTLTVVKTLIRAGNDVVFTGSGTSGTFAEIIANGKFCRSGNGGARFIGSITAGAGTPLGTNLSGGQQVCASDRDAIDFRGGGGWTASLPDRFDTDTDPRDQPVGITVTMRRP